MTEEKIGPTKWPQPIDECKFCAKCGEKLSHSIKFMKPYVGYPTYNPATGEKTRYIEMRCPNAGKWFSWGHTVEQFAMDGRRFGEYI